MQKIGGLLREAGIERRGFQEWRCGVGDGLGARYGCGLFAKLRRGGVVSVYGMWRFGFRKRFEQFKRMLGRETIRALLRCLLGLFSIGQGSAGIRGALHEKSLFVRGLFLVWRGSIPSWPVRSSRLWFEKRK